MKTCFSLAALALVLTAPMAVAQTAPPPATQAAQTSTMAPKSVEAYRWGGLSGGWLIPSGNFADAAGDGWSIMVIGHQFINPSKKIGVGSEIGYQSFGKKNGVNNSNFPVDLVLKWFPKADQGKARIYGQGGLGFNYFRTEIRGAVNTDYFFGTQAGVGVELHGKGPAALMADAVYHWIFGSGTDRDFVSVRGGILVPITR